MGFVSYPHLILQISGQTLQVNVVREIFWELNGLLLYLKPNTILLGQRLKLTELPLILGSHSYIYVCNYLHTLYPFPSFDKWK